MEKTITVRQFAAIKRVAQNVAPMVQRKQHIRDQIQKLAEEYKSIEEQIECSEMGIKALCGVGTESLVRRVVETVEGKTDKDGRPQRKTSYQPLPCLVYDEARNVYTLTIPDKEEAGETTCATPEQ